MSDDDSPQLTRDIAPFGVRMPADLKERVQAAAKANGRSTNAEIVATLEKEYPAPRVDRILSLMFQVLALMPESYVDVFVRDVRRDFADADILDEFEELRKEVMAERERIGGPLPQEEVDDFIRRFEAKYKAIKKPPTYGG